MSINDEALICFRDTSGVYVRYGSNEGKIYGDETRQFDTLVALIQQLKQGLPVDWACGNLGTKLPNEMPPVDLSLWGYAKPRLPSVGTMLKIVTAPIWLLVWPLTQNPNGDVNGDDGFSGMSLSWLWFFCGALISILLPFLGIINNFFINNDFLYITNADDSRISLIPTIIGIGYMVIIFFLGQFRLNYLRWKMKWLGGENQR
jgi:hypothetical protein